MAELQKRLALVVAATSSRGNVGVLVVSWTSLLRKSGLSVSRLLWSRHRVPYGVRPMCRIASDLGFIFHASQLAANCSSSFLAVSKAVRTMISEDKGRSPERKWLHHRVQSRNSIRCDNRLGDAGAPRNLDTTITSILSGDSSLAPLCCEPPSRGRDEGTTGKCVDDGGGLVKKLSGHLARKLQRGASLLSAGLSAAIQTVLDPATADRFDFVEICCSETMQLHGLSAFSLLRTDGVGTHDAQTREKLLGWFSEKRPRKAWSAPPVIASQNSSTRCMLQQSCNLVATFVGNGRRNVSVELRKFRAQQRSYGRELFVAACVSYCFATRENNLLEHQRWQFLTSDSRFKEYMCLQCQRNHAHVWKRSD